MLSNKMHSYQKRRNLSNSVREKHALRKKRQKLVMAILIVFTILSSATIMYSPMAFAVHKQHTLPLPTALQHEPSYAIRIPFAAADATNTFSNYDPPQVSIPAGMTVVWFNDDSIPHTVTTKSSDEGATGNTGDVKTTSPEQFDSGVIPPGGFALFTFTKPGTYDYYDKLNPTSQGQIRVGSIVAVGQDMDMRVGGSVPVNFTELSRVVLSFVPKTISLPPPSELVYNVTISNATAAVYNHQFSDIDGVLDLEIIPIGKTTSPRQIMQGNNTSNMTTFATDNINNNATDSATLADTINTTTTADAANDNNSETGNNALSVPLSASTIRTTTYGPDISAPITGTYHIEGPILVEPSPYTIRVEEISIDNPQAAPAIVDEFLLPNKIGIQ